MSQRSFLFVCCFVCAYFSLKAQFEGQGSFSTDSLLRAQLKINRVNSVTETIKKNDVTSSVGRIYFDTLARVIEATYPYRVKWEYDQGGRLIKWTSCDIKDSTKVYYWFKYDFDAKGRLLKQEHGQYEGKKLTISKISESKTISEIKGVIKRETNMYFNNNITATAISLDSVSGIYKFEIHRTYESIGAMYGLPGMSDKTEKKKLIRRYVIDSCYYEDKIEYEMDGGVETVKNIETVYDQRDRKGRVLEHGIIEIDGEYEKYLAKHPRGREESIHVSCLRKIIFGYQGTGSENDKH